MDGEPTLKRSRRRSGDVIFARLTTVSGMTIVGAIVLIAVFLLVQAVPSLLADHANFLTSSEFNTNDPDNLRFGIRDLCVVTVMSSVFALLLAVPVSMGIAIYLTQLAPRRLSKTFAAIVDLLAAVPSIVFGLWGILVLAPLLTPMMTS